MSSSLSVSSKSSWSNLASQNNPTSNKKTKLAFEVAVRQIAVAIDVCMCIAIYGCCSHPLCTHGIQHPVSCACAPILNSNCVQRRFWQSTDHYHTTEQLQHTNIMCCYSVNLTCWVTQSIQRTKNSQVCDCSIPWPPEWYFYWRSGTWSPTKAWTLQATSVCVTFLSHDPPFAFWKYFFAGHWISICILKIFLWQAIQFPFPICILNFSLQAIQFRFAFWKLAPQGTLRYILHCFFSSACSSSSIYH